MSVAVRHGWAPGAAGEAVRAHAAFYAREPGTERLDAALVLATRFGFGFGGRERLLPTLDAIRGELGHGPFLCRYSGAAEEEGCFVACSFWCAEALAAPGRVEETEDLFRRVVEGLPRGVGPISEMVDPDTGGALGNTPQGLSHLASIHTACTIRDERRRSRGRREPG